MRRPIEELLPIVLEHAEKHIEEPLFLLSIHDEKEYLPGICGLTLWLNQNNIFEKSEELDFDKWMAQTVAAERDLESARHLGVYYWERNDWATRIEWLNKQLETLEDESE